MSKPERKHDTFSLATSWIVGRRWLSTLVIVLLSAISLGGYYAPEWLILEAKSLIEPAEEEVPQEVIEAQKAAEAEEEEDYVPVPHVETLDNLGYGDAILVIHCESLFTPKGVVAIRDVVRELEELNYVYDITWVDEVPPLNFFGLRESLLPLETAPQARFDIAKEKAREHPLVNGRFFLTMDPRWFY